MRDDIFYERYANLNAAQKKAVDAIEGPVMVIAGPGTGKTQILALRIANILLKTDTPPDGILCLTFTNSGVRAMRERLLAIIGPAASRVQVSTFHSFAMRLAEEFYEDLALPAPPQLLGDADKVLLYDELLETGEWKRLRPRAGGEHNFDDLKSLISLLKRERMAPEEFAALIGAEAGRIKDDPANISSRGATKGALKSDAAAKLDALERTAEAARFFALYEETKKERNLADYDDILENIVSLAQRSENARDTLRERYLYVLVDEHQDSTSVQNEFLEAVWGDVERPNVFAVGDDRQLIYEFGGASLAQFERFSDMFPRTRTIVLTDNYRSTQAILDVAGKLLSSSLVEGGLTAQAGLAGSAGGDPVALVETDYPRDEILRAGLAMKERIAAGLDPRECAILVPKQSQARTAALILRDLGIPVSLGGKATLFSLSATWSFQRFLRVLTHPAEPHFIAALLLDPFFGVPALEAHRFLKECGRRLSLEDFVQGNGAIRALDKLVQESMAGIHGKNAYDALQDAAARLFFAADSGREASHRELLTNIEMIRTLLHLTLLSLERNPRLTLAEFADFLDKMESYGEDVPLAVFSADVGVEVLTLHGSKGREFDFVWIAHMDENSLMRGKRLGIALPEALKEKMAQKDEAAARRELYVAITRAKRLCTISYARSGYSGADQMLARIVAELPADMFEKTAAGAAEAAMLSADPLAYVTSNPLELVAEADLEIAAIVKEEFADKRVSVTHLNNFFSCPWKWYFRNFLQLPEPESEPLKFGNIMHAAIERMLKGGPPPDGDFAPMLGELFDGSMIYGAAERARFMRDGTKILKRFVKTRLPELAGAVSEADAGARRDPDFPIIEITGKIDAVKELPDGTLLVADFKTGKVKKPGEIGKPDGEGRMGGMLRQLAMYSYLLGFDAKRPAVSRSQLIFLEAEDGDALAVYETNIGREHVELLRRDLKDYVALLSSGEWTALPCDFKPFGREKECPYCALHARVAG